MCSMTQHFDEINGRLDYLPILAKFFADLPKVASCSASSLPPSVDNLIHTPHLFGIEE